MPMTTRGRRLPQGFWKGSTKKSTKAKRATRAVKSLAPRTRTAIATIAKRVVNKTSETKYITYSSTEYEGIYGDVIPAGGGIPQLFTCIPPILQGDTSYTRDGLKINPVRHQTDLRFTFCSTPIAGGLTADQSAWDLNVHIWYGYIKRYKSVSDLYPNASTILNQFLEDGQGNQQRWNGLLANEMLRVNPEYASLKHKTFRMFKNAGQMNNLVSTAGTAQTTPLHDGTRITLRWKAPKTLSYADEAETMPENYAPVLIIGYCHNDYSQASNTLYVAGSPTILNVPAVMVKRVDKLWFKDH